MTTADALLAAVLASPDDDLPRLVYADWCEENGEPERAEFIRLQIARESNTQTAAEHVREKVLLHTHAERWLAPLRQAGEPLSTQRSHVVFRRGFVEAVWIPASWFVRTARRLFSLCPVTELRVIFDDMTEPWLLKGCELLHHLRSLDVCDRRFGRSGVAALTGCPYLTGLRVLRLPGCNVDEPAAITLSDTDWSLTLLDLRHNPLSDAARTRLQNRFGTAVLFE